MRSRASALAKGRKAFHSPLTLGTPITGISFQNLCCGIFLDSVLVRSVSFFEFSVWMPPLRTSSVSKTMRILILVSSFLQGPFTQTRMVVMHGGGYRDRWLRQGLARRADLEEPAPLPEEHTPLDESADLPEADWDHIELFGGSDDLDNFEHFETPVSTAASSHGDVAQFKLLMPKPKSKPQTEPPCKSTSLGIKRTADEFSSKHLHKQISDLKQPWQKGPLSGLFSKQRNFWDKPLMGSSSSCIGIADHISANESAAAIPQHVGQREATVQRIRASRFISTDDDLRRLALSRFKTLVLLELESTRLGLSLLTFAGTLCADDELGQIFHDVFSPKSSGTLLKRCNAVWRYSCWLQNHRMGSPFSQNESVVYSYICYLRNSNAGATTPSQFVEALRFSNALLGFCKVGLDNMR